jgi:antirestriction protein
MNTEKIEKLKKSLSNPKIPADLKPKIEAEIKRLEDLDAKSSQPKEESKEEDKPVAKKTTTRKPRATKTVAKKTSTRKPSETSNPKRTIMSVAKEIRKEGESWKDAQERAKKVMKKDSQEVTKTIETELQKLNKLVKSRKELRSQVGKTDLLRDAKRKAKPMGRRISKEGNVYYENRANRTDRGSFGKYHLAEGGYLTDPTFGNFQNQVFADGGGIPNNYAGKTPEQVWNMWSLNQKEHFLSDHLTEYQKSTTKYSDNKRLAKLIWYDVPFGIKKLVYEHINMGQYAKGGGVRRVGNREYSLGRNWTNDHNHVNKGEDHEVKYTRKKRFATGGGVDGKEVINLKAYAYSGNVIREGDFVINYNDNTITFPSGKTFKVVEDREYTFKIQKTQIKANRGVRGLSDFLKEINTPNTPFTSMAMTLIDLGKDDKFELGGVMATDLAGHTGGTLGTGDPSMLSGVSGTSYTGLVGETGAMSSGEMFEAGGTLPDGVSQSYMVTEGFGNPAQHYEGGGGLPSGAEQSYVNYYLGEGSAQGIYAKGGGIRKVGNREYSLGRNWTNDHNHVNKGEDHEVKYTRKKKFLGIFNDGGGVEDVAVIYVDDYPYYIKKMGDSTHFKMANSKNGVDVVIPSHILQHRGESYYEDVRSWLKGGANPNGKKYMSNDSYAKGGGVRRVGNREYSLGRNWTNDHNHVNKGEDHEVKYTRKKSFAGGGGVGETPRIYVADLEAYNNGRLQGEWLDLSDYNDADELMDAIQDLLDQWGVEEYAIHDVEYVPRGIYSEYMGKKDFEELYELMDLAKDNDLPLEVVEDVVSQYGTSAVEEFQGKYDSAVDFAQEMVDELGIESFNDFEYYLDISETDRRLLSQEMADSYVDDIRDEDGGNRLIEEAGMDVSEYEDADSDRQEEMLDEAREIVYDEYYDNWYEGLSDPYYFLVEEQGLYDAESFANANFVQVDYQKLADALEQDYTFIEHDGELYVFNIR